MNFHDYNIHLCRYNCYFLMNEISCLKWKLSYDRPLFSFLYDFEIVERRLFSCNYFTTIAPCITAYWNYQRVTLLYSWKWICKETWQLLSCKRAFLSKTLNSIIIIRNRTQRISAYYTRWNISWRTSNVPCNPRIVRKAYKYCA